MYRCWGEMEPEIKQALDTMREHFDYVIAANEKRWEVIEDNHKESLKTAVEANERRFSGLNGFREAMADQANRMVTREEAESNRNALTEKVEATRSAMESRVEAEIRPMQARLEEIGRPNWALITSMASGCAVVIGAVWMIIGLNIEAKVSPLMLEISIARTTENVNAERIATLNNMATSSTAADNASRTDREQLNNRSRLMEAQINAARTEQSVVQARLAEVETQFCARDIVSNLMHANDLRMISMIWRKVFENSVYPTDNAFYPKVCNQNVPLGTEKGSQ